MGQKVVLKNVTVAYPDVWKAKEYTEGDGKPRYTCNYLIEPNSENDKAIRAAINAAAVETWKDDAIVTLRRVSGDKATFCYRNGATQKNERFHGMWFIAGSRREADGRPGVCGPGGKDDRLTEESGKPYSGCIANATIDIWAQKGKYEGVRCTLLGLQFVADGPAFSGSPASTDDFEPLGEGDSSMDDFGDLAANGDGF